MNRKLKFVILFLWICLIVIMLTYFTIYKKQNNIVIGENMQEQEYIKKCFEKLNLLGITIDEKEQEETINNINQMPEEILNNLENAKILGLILDHMGATAENKSVYSFDMEVFEPDTMYTEFLNNINLLTNHELKISVIKEDTSYVDYKEGTGIQIIEFEILDKEYKFEAKANYDWFDINIIRYLNEIIEENNGNKFLYRTSDGWQNCIVFYHTEEWAKEYNKNFPELQIKK